MTDSLSDKVINTFELNEKQDVAAKELSRDVVVTAGAGSGKTRTLVARYAGLLAQGVEPRRIAAITFTTKAAMQMRAKVRESITTLEQAATDLEERKKWSDLSAKIDSARIGTIHSLCAEILRNHPAEAGLDPRFEVLDEGLSQVLKNQVVEDTLNNLIEEERFIPLFENLKIKDLTKLLKELLEKRFEAQEIFEIKVNNTARLVHEIQIRVSTPSISEAIRDLRELSYQEIENDSGISFAEMAQDLLGEWTRAELALEENDPIACATHLNKGISVINKNKGKNNSSLKPIVAEFRDQFDKIVEPLTQRKASNPPSIESEQLFESLLPLLRDAFTLVHQAYQEQLQKRQALDFDDLEYCTYQLLKREDIRQHWQQELDAVMVDEYQDTNQYQRDIVNSLAGKRGCLFIVGDMRQSIYRFRRADVTVFREEQERIENENGESVELDLTYRQHEPLLKTMADVLATVIGTEEDPTRSYYVPFTSMVANSAELPDGISSPHMEFVYGVGEDARSARPVAARALAKRLLELKKEGQIQKWDDVAMLFRASTGFPFYEEAFEEAGIPFVTVAGRGFYDRPEIRDLVNILRALSNPADDLAFAGLLRSPAFGLSDTALFQLRSKDTSYWQMLQDDLSVLSIEDRYRAQRCGQILEGFLPLVDRIPVAELLKKVVDVLDYRALLATTDTKAANKTARAAGGRLWRNVDKLLEDTQASQAATVRDFLDMLSTLDDAGAREGEAPAEADGSVRLMTIHKAKGLEFPVVVLADAGRKDVSNSELVYLSNELGITFKIDPPPMLYSLAKQQDKDQDECETLRVLYVALTRAQHKLIISGHATLTKKGVLLLSGWAKTLDEAVGNPMEACLQSIDEPVDASTSHGYPLRAILTKTMPTFEEPPSVNSDANKPMEGESLPLYQPIVGFGKVEADETEDRFTEIQSWRVFQPDERVSGKTIGKLVHKSLQLWLFPGDSRLTEMLATEAYNQGLVSTQQRQEASDRVCELLSRLQKHPLWAEVEAASERYSELPSSFIVNKNVDNKVTDLLYKDAKGWHLVDFKTDPIHTLAEKESRVRKYSNQVRSYQQAAQSQLQQSVDANLVFLDDFGKVSMVEV